MNLLHRMSAAQYAVRFRFLLHVFCALVAALVILMKRKAVMAHVRRTALVAALLSVLIPAFAQTVLYSARPAVALSVSDKMAIKQPRVTFTVTMPDGRTTSAVAEPQMGGERAGTVHYPSDFGNAGTRVGEYAWSARVGDKVVLRGRFAYRAGMQGQDLFVPD